MKIKYLTLFLIFSLNTFSQLKKNEKINIGLIVGVINPYLTEFVTSEKSNSKYELSEYDFDFNYGEYKIDDVANKKDTIQYNENGVIKYDYLIKTRTGDKNINDTLQIGKNGEILNNKNLRYKYNSKGQVIELFEYSSGGSEIKKHYGFNYNEKNQIFEVKRYWINNTIARDISSYTYNSFGNIILMKNYSLTTNKNLPKSEHFKYIWNYNSKNQLISYHSYETNYGYYWDIGTDLYKYVNRKKFQKHMQNIKLI